MAQKYPFSMWVYNPFEDFTPDVLELWVDCGMSIPLAPKMYLNKHKAEDLLPWLDKAESLGVKIIANFEGLDYGAVRRFGVEEVERRLRSVYEPIKGHPALYGFYAGDEPWGKENLAATVECFKLHKKVAPELRPYINFIGMMPDAKPEDLDGKTLEEWLQHIVDESGDGFASQDLYCSTINQVGVRNDIYALRNIVTAAEKSGFDIWANTLCSAHYAYQAPNYFGILWQITVPAACGCKGNIWFRFYDRALGHEYHSSPIDEYGNKTDTYYSILRAQKRFNDHYGELIMTLKRKSTYMLGETITDVYPKFNKGDHDLVSVSATWDDILVSFFEDKDGNEYICAVNAMKDIHGSLRLCYDKEKCSVYEVLLNGQVENLVPPGDEYEEGRIPLYQAQMRMFRIERK